MEDSKVEIWYRDIDPDTGNYTKESKLCTCESQFIANWVMTALHNDMSLHYDDPNRELFFKYLVDVSKLDSEEAKNQLATIISEYKKDIVIDDDSDIII